MHEYSEKEYREQNSQKSLETLILSELGAESLEDVANAMKNETWPFKIQPKDLWKKLVDYFEQPLSPEDIVDLLVGNKTEDDIKKSLEKKQWPFNITEEEMRNIVQDSKQNE